MGNELEPCIEFSRAEAGLMEALAAHGTAVEDVEMLALVFVRPCSCRQFEMGCDDIVDGYENGRGALLAVSVDHKLKAIKTAPLHCRPDLADRRLVPHLVAPDGLKADRL